VTTKDDYDFPRGYAVHRTVGIMAFHSSLSPPSPSHCVVTEGFGVEILGRRYRHKKKHGHRFTQISAVKNKEEKIRLLSKLTLLSRSAFICVHPVPLLLAFCAFSCGI